MPSSKLFASDFDGVFYPFLPEHAHSMNIAFAAAARSLNPNIPSQAIELAAESFKKHGDSTIEFVKATQNSRYKIDSEQLHRLTHMILDTSKWEKIDGVAAQIQRLQKQGQFVIWTHGSKNTVLRTMDQLGIYGLIDEKDIYDLYTHGRKDIGKDPYIRLSEKRGVQLDNSSLSEDTLRNLDHAKQARWNTIAVLHNPINEKPNFVDRLHWNAEKAFRKVAEHLEHAHGALQGGSHATPQGAVLAPR